MPEFSRKLERIQLEEQVEDLDFFSEFDEEEGSVLGPERERALIDPNPNRKKKRAAQITAFALMTAMAVGVVRDKIFASFSSEPRELAPISKYEPTHAEKISELAATRQGRFEQLESVIKKEKLKEKLDELTQEYGADALDQFTAIYNIRRILETVEKIRTSIDSGEQDPFDLNGPKKNTGPAMLDRYAAEWTDVTSAEAQSLAKPIRFTGFEKAGIDNIELQRAVEHAFPDIWLHASVKEVTYVDAAKKSTYHLAGGERAGASDQIGEVISYSDYSPEMLLDEEGRVPVLFYKTSTKLTPESIIYFLSHELAHANDWQSSKVLSVPERIQLLYDVTQRANAKDHLKSPYVEAITGPDAKKVKYEKAVEYFAEVSRAFLRDKDSLKRTNPADYELANHWFKIMEGSQ